MTIINNPFQSSINPFYPTHVSQNLVRNSLELVKMLPQFTEEQVSNLLNVYRGPDGGRMETLGLLKTVNANETYIIQEGIQQKRELFAIDLEHEARNPARIEVPPFLEFEAEWDTQTVMTNNGNNILGDNGGLYFKESQIQIPTVKATAETLAYYGAVLIPENTAIRFPDEEAYPLWQMHVGSNYVQDYIMTPEGGGFYLEYHHDQPHFHMVLDGGGHYLLAKQTGKNRFQITAFELSNGQAVYTKKGAIHCDAGLTGHLIVGYTASNDCSTVLLRTKDTDEQVRLNFN